MDVLKKESYHLFCMQSKQNESTSVCSNETVNSPILVLRAGLWPSHEMLGHYMLNIFCPNILQDVRRSKILLNHHVILAWKLSFFHIFFSFAHCTKNHVAYMIQMNYLLISEIENFKI